MQGLTVLHLILTNKLQNQFFTTGNVFGAGKTGHFHATIVENINFDAFPDKSYGDLNGIGPVT